jgi:hypothetical protein
MKVLTITLPGQVETEIHLLNPGENFPGFGGSRHGLTVRKTASLITRTRHTGPDGFTDDIELDIHEPGVWKWLARLINGEVPGTTAATKEG